MSNDLMNRLIRGHPPEAEAPTGLGGGARRRTVPPGPPSMDSLIRAEVEAKRGWVYEQAYELDRIRRHQREIG